MMLCLTLCLTSASAFAQDAQEAQDAPAADEGWVSLLPTSTDAIFEGWQTDNDNEHTYWTIEDGQLIGENPDRRGSVLWTQAQYTNYEIVVEYMTPSQDYDSGVFLRGPSHQVQIGISRSLHRDMTACIYAPRDGQGGYPGQTDTVEDVHRVGEWNTLRVLVTGSRMQTFLNGQAMVDYTGTTFPEEGRVGLQLHPGVHMRMLFRAVRIRPIEVE